MQTILGSGGAIGTELAKALNGYRKKVRLISRNPIQINPSDELLPLDLMKADNLTKAIEGSEVVYLTLGLPYKTRIWQEHWPVIMEKTIDACAETGAQLVFLDNMYMYDPDHIEDMTEETPIRPVSKKGIVRATVAQKIMTAVDKGRIEALIARAADFYGPAINNSVLLEMVFKNLQKGKKANWFCSTAYRHAFTYTPDAGKAAAYLGNESTAYNQVWHLPTAPAMTGREWIEAFATAMKITPKTQIAGKFIVSVMGLFNPIMKEFSEMLYQWDRDYVFNSNKIERYHHLMPTPTTKAIAEICSMG
jgi:nucleoside-diphosphate-sugar epimerase